MQKIEIISIQESSLLI